MRKHFPLENPKKPAMASSPRAPQYTTYAGITAGHAGHANLTENPFEEEFTEAPPSYTPPIKPLWGAPTPQIVRGVTDVSITGFPVIETSVAETSVAETSVADVSATKFTPSYTDQNYETDTRAISLMVDLFNYNLLNPGHPTQAEILDDLFALAPEMSPLDRKDFLKLLNGMPDFVFMNYQANNYEDTLVIQTKRKDYKKLVDLRGLIKNTHAIVGLRHECTLLLERMKRSVERHPSEKSRDYLRNKLKQFAISQNLII